MASPSTPIPPELKQAGLRAKFPHMSAADSFVWQEAVDLKLFTWDTVEYDVNLASRKSMLVDQDHELLLAWQTLTSKRIDVLLTHGTAHEIVEVKPQASFAALGQALGYKYMWEAEFGRGRKASATVLAAEVDTDLEPIFGAYGVRLVLLPDASAKKVLFALHQARLGIRKPVLPQNTLGGLQHSLAGRSSHR